MIDISIIILNWNGKEWLKDCYESLRAQTFKNFQIILADNASSDDSIEYTKKFFPEVKIIGYNKNLGYTEANNRASYQAAGEYLLFLNNDTRLEYNCLEELMKYVQDTKCCICAVNFLDYDATILQLPDEIMGMGVDIFGYPVPSEKIFYSDGAALFINKVLFVKLNGFDQKHFIFAEDIDLSWRAQLQGYNIGFVKTAIVHHERGGTVIGSSTKKGDRHVTSIRRRYLTERNTLRNLIKNYSFSTLLFVLPLFLLMIIFEISFFLLIGKSKVAKKVYFRALIYNMEMLPDTIREHEIIQKERKLRDIEILKRMNWNKFYKLEVFKKIGVPIFK